MRLISGVLRCRGVWRQRWATTMAVVAGVEAEGEWVTRNTDTFPVAKAGAARAPVVRA